MQNLPLNDFIVSHDAVAAKAQYEGTVNLFLADCRMRNLSPVTIEGYHVYLKQFQHDLENWGLSLDTLHPKDLSVRMIHGMLDRQLKPNTINGRIRALQQFFKFLYLDEHLEVNLAAGLKPIPNKERIVQTFTEEQVRLLLDAPDQTTFTGLRDYTIMLVFLETGIRVLEMTRLCVSDINFEEQTILIRMAKNRKSRSIPIQATCVDALLRYLHERGPQPFDALWITLKQQPIARFSIIDMVKVYMKKVGITDMRGSCHLFRHTMAKFFLLNGGDIFTLQYLLGHATLEMTRHYVELFSSDLRQQHEKFSPVENLMGELANEGEVHPS